MTYAGARESLAVAKSEGETDLNVFWGNNASSILNFDVCLGTPT
jgi:hypothetical protein